MARCRADVCPQLLHRCRLAHQTGFQLLCQSILLVLFICDPPQ